jgi:hypothetical protein
MDCRTWWIGLKCLRSECRQHFPATPEIESDKCMHHGASLVLAVCWQLDWRWGVFRVAVDNLKAYFDFDPKRKHDLEQLID